MLTLAAGLHELQAARSCARETFTGPEDTLQVIIERPPRRGKVRVGLRASRALARAAGDVVAGAGTTGGAPGRGARPDRSFRRCGKGRVFVVGRGSRPEAQLRRVREELVLLSPWIGSLDPAMHRTSCVRLLRLDSGATLGETAQLTQTLCRRSSRRLARPRTRRFQRCAVQKAAEVAAERLTARTSWRARAPALRTSTTSSFIRARAPLRWPSAITSPTTAWTRSFTICWRRSAPQQLRRHRPWQAAEDTGSGRAGSPPGAAKPTLLSWSGSMFEYLMPLLVMPRTWRHTLLDRDVSAGRRAPDRVRQ